MCVCGCVVYTYKEHGLGHRVQVTCLNCSTQNSLLNLIIVDSIELNAFLSFFVFCIPGSSFVLISWQIKQLQINEEEKIVRTIDFCEISPVLNVN